MIYVLRYAERIQTVHGHLDRVSHFFCDSGIHTDVVREILALHNEDRTDRAVALCGIFDPQAWEPSVEPFQPLCYVLNTLSAMAVWAAEESIEILEKYADLIALHAEPTIGGMTARRVEKAKRDARAPA